MKTYDEEKAAIEAIVGKPFAPEMESVLKLFYLAGCRRGTEEAYAIVRGIK